MAHITETERRPVTLPKYRPLMLGQGIGILAILLDVFIIVALSVASGILYHLYVYGVPGDIGSYANIGALTSLFYLLPRSLKGHYDTARMIAARYDLRQSFTVWNFAFFCLLAVSFAAKLTDDYSRGAVMTFYFVGFAGVTLLRAAIVSFCRHGFDKGWLATRRILLVGSRRKVAEFMERYAPERFGSQVADAIILPEMSSRKISIEALRSGLEKTVERTRDGAIDDIVLLLPWSQARMIKRCAEMLLTVPASIHLGPDEMFERFGDMRLSRIGRATSLNLVRPPLNAAELCAKRVIDLAGAIAGLVVLSPLLLLVALLIKLDSPGPALFFQRRHGFNNKPFWIIKFRTMTVYDDGPFVLQATANDPRVTRIGHFLRRWNIDELPQLLNVVRGDMSIVGPRPHAMVHNHEFERQIALYARRHNVKPGITGWAQVNGLRGPTDTEEKLCNRVEHDLYYIDNWSVWFDLYIMVMTVVSPRAFQNAY